MVFLPFNCCVKGKFRARRIVSHIERAGHHDEARRLRVAAAFFADAERSAADRLADA
jgi:hypothetical protein